LSILTSAAGLGEISQPSIIKAMWKKLFTPEILFCLGTIQALLPYVIWHLFGANTSYNYEITYLPVVIWVVGYIAFWVGTKLVRPDLSSDVCSIKLSLSGTKVATWVTISLVILQIMQSLKVYGVLPIYGYLTGTANVLEINEFQRDSGFGQFGFLTASLFFLNGLLLILLIKGMEAQRQPKFIFLIAFGVEVFGSLIAGKRQGLLICLTFLACGLSLYFNNPLKPILNLLNLPSGKSIRIFIYAATVSGLVGLMGWFSSLRIGSGVEISGISEILNYLQYPLINLEAQCAEIGLNPDHFNFFYPLLTLLPYKSYEVMAPALSELPMRLEPTIGAGFYGNIHWGLGLLGIIIYALLFGWLSKYCYRKAAHQLTYLLIYCQIAWTLLSAHTYNHFFTLIFLPVPALLFLVFSVLFNSASVQPKLVNQ
jgi:oligosaccharide repeat unit polymerase